MPKQAPNGRDNVPNTGTPDASGENSNDPIAGTQGANAEDPDVPNAGNKVQTIDPNAGMGILNGL